MPPINWTKNTIWQFTLLAECLAQDIVNAWHFEASGAYELTFGNDQARIDAGDNLITSFLANAMTEWRACHPAEYVVNTVKCQAIEVKNQWRHKLTPVERPLTANNAGTGTGTVENIQTSVVMRWRTPQAGKHHRGRTYIGPLSNTWMDNGLVVSAQQTPYNTFGAKMIAAYGASGTEADNFIKTVYSRPYLTGEYGYPVGQNPNRTFYYPPDYGGNSTNVTAYNFDPVLRGQRRRQIGVGG